MSKRKSQSEIDPAAPSGDAAGEPRPEEAGAETGEAAGPELLEQLGAQRDEAVAARQRALADLANFQRRAQSNELRAVATGSARVIRSVLGVLDHFDLALNQDHTRIDLEQLVGGVRIVRDELLKALRTHGVERVEPAVGDEFDPNCHEAMRRVDVEGARPNTIASVLQPGYVMGDMVLRPAKVAVAAAEEDD